MQFEREWMNERDERRMCATRSEKIGRERESCGSRNRNSKRKAADEIDDTVAVAGNSAPHSAEGDNLCSENALETTVMSVCLLSRGRRRRKPLHKGPKMIRCCRCSRRRRRSQINWMRSLLAVSSSPARALLTDSGHEKCKTQK